MEILSRCASVLRLAAGLTYLASLLLVPFHTSYPNLDWRGLGILLLGWTTLPAVFAWLANPLVIFALLRMGRYPRVCLVLCLLAVLAALDSHQATRFSFGFDSSRDVADGQIRSLGAGAYVWFCSLALAFAASALHVYVHFKGAAVRPIPLRSLLMPAVLLVATSAAAYAYHAWSARNENARLTGIVQARLEQLYAPPGSTFIYQESEASRLCKTASAVRLFATDLDHAAVCQSVLAVVEGEGWYGGVATCEPRSYPARGASRPGERPPYSYSMAYFRAPDGQFTGGVTAKPAEAWGRHFMLGTWGEQEAIPLARKRGKTFYTVRLRYTEDRSQSKADCYPSAYAWKFADGRTFSRWE